VRFSVPFDRRYFPPRLTFRWPGGLYFGRKANRSYHFRSRPVLNHPMHWLGCCTFLSVTALIRKIEMAQLTPSVERRIAQHVQRQIDSFLEFWADPKTVVGYWTANRLHLSITLPFSLPLPTEQADDYLATKADIRKFRSTVRKQYLEQMRIEKLSNLLFAEYAVAVQKYIGVYRFGEGVVRELPRITERRLAGRPSTKISGTQWAILQKQLRQITKVLRDVKAQIPAWKKQSRGRKGSLLDEFLKSKIRDHLSDDEPAWNRFLFRCFRKLPSRVSLRGTQYDRRLSEPRSWSASSWARCVVQEIHYRRTGSLVPAAKLTTS
jgi:hypothetical protein